MTSDNPSNPEMAVRKRTRPATARKKLARRRAAIWSFAVIFSLSATVGVFRSNSNPDSEPVYPGAPPAIPQLSIETAQPTADTLFRLRSPPARLPNPVSPPPLDPRSGRHSCTKHRQVTPCSSSQGASWSHRPRSPR